jgi:hypothetical protein
LFATAILQCAYLVLLQGAVSLARHKERSLQQGWNPGGHRQARLLRCWHALLFLHAARCHRCTLSHRSISKTREAGLCVARGEARRQSIAEARCTGHLKQPVRSSTLVRIAIEVGKNLARHKHISWRLLHSPTLGQSAALQVARPTPAMERQRAQLRGISVLNLVLHSLTTNRLITFLILAHLRQYGWVRVEHWAIQLVQLNSACSPC